MDLGSYEGIIAGGDRLSEPPGVPLFGQSEIGDTDFDWSHSKMKERLRDNRMPPGMPFDITEANRDGPIVLVGEEVGAEQPDSSDGGSIQSRDSDIESETVRAAWKVEVAHDAEVAFCSHEDDK